MHSTFRVLVSVIALSVWACDRSDTDAVIPNPLAEQPAVDSEVGEEVPEERPKQDAEEAPEATPATASPTEPTEGRPPHPAIPPPLEEQQPSPNTLASTTFRWLQGHWVWSGNEYVWQPGVWVYDLPGYIMLPAQWRWDGEYWTFRDAGWASPGTSQASYRPTALPDGTATMAPAPDPNEAQVDLEVSVSSYAAYVWTGTWIAPPIVYPSADDGSVARSRYTRRMRSGVPDASPEPSPESASLPPADGEGIVNPVTPPTNTKNDDDAEVEYIPGVLHGGKRGEEELRQMQEAQEREAAEQAEAENAVVVPYYYNYPVYYRPVRPVRPRPPRPAPPPGRPPPNRPPGPGPRPR